MEFGSFTFQTLRFLEESPSSSQSTDRIVNFLEAVKTIKLTKRELLMLVNDPPSAPLHIQLLIEDSEERLSEDEVARILEMSRNWLLPEEPQE